MVRSNIRFLYEHLWLAGGAARRGRQRVRDRALILAYHNVIPSGHSPGGDRSLHLPLQSFLDQVELLERYFEIVSLEELGIRGPGNRPLASITFDDAYRGALELGIPELVRRDLPATVFVCPGLLGEGGFWWDRLGAKMGDLPKDVRKRVLLDLQGKHREVLSDFSTEPMSDWWMLPGTVEGVTAAAGEPGITFASHTWTHPNLASLPAEEIEDQLTMSRDWLLDRFPDRTLKEHVSFPYGSYGVHVTQAAEVLGFRFLYRVEGGHTSTPPLQGGLVPRMNIPSGMSRRGFELRVSGAGIRNG